MRAIRQAKYQSEQALTSTTCRCCLSGLIPRWSCCGAAAATLMSDSGAFQEVQEVALEEPSGWLTVPLSRKDLSPSDDDADSSRDGFLPARLTRRVLPCPQTDRGLFFVCTGSMSASVYGANSSAGQPREREGLAHPPDQGLRAQTRPRR